MDSKIDSPPAGWRASLFIVCIFVVSAFRFFLTADLNTNVVYSPHDASLYVERAYHYLGGNGFGPYHSRLLAKLPGFSFLLAWVRMLGIPYFLFVNGLLIISGLYFVWGLLRTGVPRWGALLAFSLMMIHPVTLEWQWINTMREPISVSLWLFYFGSLFHLLFLLRSVFRMLPHLICFSLVLGFSLIFREDEKVLLLAWGFFIIGTLALEFFRTRIKLWPWASVLCLLFVPLAFVAVADILARNFIARHYGLRILHDLVEGEYAGFLAALRNVNQQVTNRHVLFSQEKITRLAQWVPEFRPVAQALPAPSPDTESCIRYGVCSEWDNGHFVFWIKDAAFDAGMTPTLEAAQVFFGKMRLRIEELCRGRVFECSQNGKGWLPPFSFQWTRAYWQEWKYLMKVTFLGPRGFIESMPESYTTTADLARLYQLVTMVPLNDHKSKPPVFGRAQSQLRKQAAIGFIRFEKILVVFGGLCFLFLLLQAKILTPVLIAVGSFYAFLFFRNIALTHVSVTMGHLDVRLFFAANVCLVGISTAICIQCFRDLTRRLRVPLARAGKLSASSPQPA